jgi:hypothetical protein
MSRLVVQVARREVSSVATAVVEFGPGQPVRYAAEDRVLSDVLQLERPLPLAMLVRQVLTRYGLEPAAETDCAPFAEAPCAEAPCAARSRGGLPA